MFDKLLGLSLDDNDNGWVKRPPSDDYWYGPRSSPTVSGENINEDSALGITTALACMAKKAKSIAMLPVDVVEKKSETVRLTTDHPLAALLTGAANDECSGFSLREAMAFNLDDWGGGYAYIEWQRPRMREVKALWVMEGRKTRLIRDDKGNIAFLYNHGGGKKDVYPAEKVWHVPGLSLNGIDGLSVIGCNREALGLEKAAEKFGAAFFGNGAWAGGFVKRPLDAPKLSDEAAQRFIDSINEKFRGAGKAFGIGLLRENMEFQQLNMPFEDAMFLGTRQFQRTQICSMFDVPPIMIQDVSESRYRNTEEASKQFGMFTIAPLCDRFERAARLRFFQGTNLYLKHNLAGLLRGDFKSSCEGWATLIDRAVISPNEVREKLDMNPAGSGCDNHYMQVNMAPIDDPRRLAQPARGDEAIATVVVPHSYPAGWIDDESKPKQPSPRHPGESQAWPLDKPNAKREFHNPKNQTKESDIVDVFNPMIEHAAERIAARQCKAATAAWKKHAKGGNPNSFKQWADHFFVEHAEIVSAELAPIVKTWERATGQPPTESGLPGRLCREWQAAVMERSKSPQGVPSLVDEWKRSLATDITACVITLLKGDKEHDNANA